MGLKGGKRLKFSVLHHTEAYRGDHGADVVEAYELKDGETVEDLMCRIFGLTFRDGSMIPRYQDWVTIRFMKEAPMPSEGERRKSPFDKPSPCGCGRRTGNISRSARFLWPTAFVDCHCIACNKRWVERYEFDFDVPVHEGGA